MCSAPPSKEALLRQEGANLDEVRDLAAAGTRYLASDTTGIVCFPSCRNARRITPAHRHGFASLAAAGRSGFRPCLHCMPFYRAVRSGNSPLRKETPMTTRLRQRWLLAVLVAGQFMANVDIAIVNVATPSIHRDLHASGGALEFVVSGYVLAFAMLIITGARLGRIAGYRRAYLAGLAGFTLASLACSLAPGAGALIAARIAQGACAAVMVPQVLTGIQVSFEGRARARALSVLVMTMSGSAVIGQALGGPLIAADVFGTGWRSIFWVNVPVGVVALAGAAVLLPRESRGAPAWTCRGWACSPRRWRCLSPRWRSAASRAGPPGPGLAWGPASSRSPASPPSSAGWRPGAAIR